MTKVTRGTLKALKEMIEIPSISGNEGKFSHYLKNEFSRFADEAFLDKIGNVIAIKGKPRIALFAHVDTVGFMVKVVRDDIIEVVKIGYPEDFHGQSVRMYSHEDTLRGHIFKKDKQILIDTSMKRALNLVEVGDFVGYTPYLEREGNSLIGPGLDNKVGCFVALEVFKEMDNIAFVGTIKEESDQQGALSAVYNLRFNLDLAVIVDTTYGSDLFNRESVAVGRGTVISLKDTIMPRRENVDEMVHLALDEGFRFQREVSEGGESDARSIFHQRGGIPFLFVGVAAKYPHSAFEMVNIKDINETIRLLKRYVALKHKSLKKGEEEMCTKKRRP